MLSVILETACIQRTRRYLDISSRFSNIPPSVVTLVFDPSRLRRELEYVEITTLPDNIFGDLVSLQIL